MVGKERHGTREGRCVGRSDNLVDHKEAEQEQQVGLNNGEGGLRGGDVGQKRELGGGITTKDVSESHLQILFPKYSDTHV